MRIELGEIESVLSTHSGTEQVVVMAREDTPGEKQLAAYYVPNQEAMPSVQNLRDFVKQKLPNYMVPSIFVEMDTLPLNPNGKVDRKVLPSPDSSQRQNNLIAPPRTPTEIRLAEIWSGLLDLEQVGIHNDFFELGGHSLMATQVVSRIRKAFQIEFPRRNLFEASTIAELALKITQLQLEQEDQEEMARLLEELEHAD